MASKQARWQRKQVEAGRCRICGDPVCARSRGYCERHRLMRNKIQAACQARKRAKGGAPLMLAVEFVWAEPATGRTHRAAPGDGADALLARLGRPPDRVVVVAGGPRPLLPGVTTGYLPTTAEHLRAAFALPEAVAALEEAEAALAAHARAATCTADEQTLAIVRAALVACREG